MIEQKRRVRREMLEALRALRAEERDLRSEKIVRGVRKLEEWDAAGTVMLFHPMRSEPDVTALLEAAGKRVVLPRVVGDRLELFEYAGEQALRRAEYGMLEPDPEVCVEVAVGEVDLVVVPGLAFERDGGARLGRGGGFYDRLLTRADFRGVTVGVCFEFQLVAGMRVEAHDRRVSRLVFA